MFLIFDVLILYFIFLLNTDISYIGTKLGKP